MEQQTVANPAVIHGLCAMTFNKSAMHCSLRLAPTMINHLTSTLGAWSSTKLLKFNSSKCKTMFISRRRLRRTEPSPLFLDGSLIEAVDCIKYRRSGNFAVKIISRSRPTAKIKHAKNKLRGDAQCISLRASPHSPR